MSEHPSYVFCKLYRLVRANHQNDLIMFALAVNDDCRKSTKADQITERINLNTKAFFLLSTLFSGGDRTVEHIAEILEKGIVNGMTADDVQKILNLKHSWEFILDQDVIQAETDYHLLCHVAKLVNEGFFSYGGKIRSVPVTIGGTSYVPPIPIESMVIENINEIRSSDKVDIDKAIELCMYCMKTQVFVDGNKRASVIFANHYLISHGQGLLVIPEKDVPEFKKLLVAYYEGEDINVIATFLKEKCWKRMD